jgi:hypothetical protein
MTIPKYFASLEAAWFSEGVPRLGQALVGAGWHRLPWAEDDDWHGQWMDRVHPDRETAADLLERLMSHLPEGTKRVLIVGDSTLTQHLRESWDGDHLSFNWEDRARCLREAGAPPHPPPSRAQSGQSQVLRCHASHGRSSEAADGRTCPTRQF